MLRLGMGGISTALALMLAGCAGSEDPGTTAADVSSTGGASTTTDGSSTTAASTSTTAAAESTSSTTDAADSSSTSTAADGSSSTGAGSSSTGPGCELGTLDCACDEDACQDDLVCMDDVCEPPPNCPQEDSEPNDVEADAPEFDELDDFNPNLEFVDGRLPSAEDVDWFSYRCDDNALGQVDMNFEIDTPIPVRVCQYIECDIADTPVVLCPDGSDADTSPDGLPGCCTDLPSLSITDIDCSTDSNDDSGRIFLRVDEPAMDACVSYDLGYHC
ncbi:MAG: hypothetical protein AAGA54_33790 [Myxococcota bacterium]